MSNNNCLSGLRCPNCGSYGPYRIAITTLATVTDDGTDEYEGAEWEDDSYCGCISCLHDAKIKDFADVDNAGRFKECKLCDETRQIDAMHLHQDEWICNDCWDESKTVYKCNHCGAICKPGHGGEICGSCKKEIDDPRISED